MTYRVIEEVGVLVYLGVEEIRGLHHIVTERVGVT